MNKGIIKLISALLILFATSGCSITGPNSRPILSAADAHSMIQVTLMTQRVTEADDTLVASAN